MKTKIGFQEALGLVLGYVPLGPPETVGLVELSGLDFQGVHGRPVGFVRHRPPSGRVDGHGMNPHDPQVPIDKGDVQRDIAPSHAELQHVRLRVDEQHAPVGPE